MTRAQCHMVEQGIRCPPLSLLVVGMFTFQPTQQHRHLLSPTLLVVLTLFLPTSLHRYSAVHLLPMCHFATFDPASVDITVAVPVTRAGL